MKLLLAEDDERTADSLRMGLAEQGFVVDVTGRGGGAVSRADDQLFADSRTLIAAQVWDMAFERDSNVVDVHVRRQRARVVIRRAILQAD